MSNEDEEIIQKCNAFLKKSSNRYSKTVLDVNEAAEIASGDFWNENVRKKYRNGKNRLCLSLNNYSTICNAISSPVSNSPWHIELKDKESQPELQEAIDIFEAENGNKSILVSAFKRAVQCGMSYVVVTTVNDEFTSEPKVVLEEVKKANQVALDPHCTEVDGSDAEEGAIINYISISKAKRLYGDDVLPMDYPRTSPFFDINNLEYFTLPDDTVAIVSYYYKSNEGVSYRQICGNKIVKSAELPITYIPIIRISGYEVQQNGLLNYQGIVQKLFPLELGANISYSTLLERCGRSPKSNFIVHVDAIDGLEKQYAMLGDDRQACILWKGEHQPVPMTEGFQTGDLQNTITTSRMLMEDVAGVPLTGIQGERERTATEIMRQELSKESNSAELYNNAFKAWNTLAKIIIQLNNDGKIVLFTLENGPSVITRQMKARQELSVLATIVPDNMKSLIAKYYADSLEDDIGREMSENIVANLPEDVKFISQNQDPAAIHEMNQMKSVMEATMSELEESKKIIQELQNKLTAQNLQMLENSKARELDWEKFKVEQQNKMNLEMAKLQAEHTVDTTKLEQNQQKLNMEATKVVLENEKDMTEAINQNVVEGEY